ncbi:MAG: acyloxyacyl hydrolase [Fluviicola sp.]|jgi:hypothetical protein|nr:acyloxyacyl hydrolase [Fluviicola sp.]
MKYYVVFFLLLMTQFTWSQKNLTWGIEARTKVGFLAAHHNTLYHLPTNLAYAQELSFFIKPNGSKQWHIDYKKPLIGITAFAGSVSNNQVLGRFYGAYQFIEFPFIQRKHFQLTAKLGNGFAYGTKEYDPITNPKNTAIGSHLNALICIALKNRFIFNRHQFSIGIDISHCSNAASKTPNLGINLPFLSLSYGYTVGESKNVDSIKNYTHHFRKLYFGATGILSQKEIYPTGGKRYAVYGLSLFSRYLFKPKVGLEIAFDLFSKQSILGYKTDIKKDQLDIVQMGIFAGYILPLNKMHFILGMGVYVRDKYQPDTFLYHRVGMRYFLKNGIFFNVVLKSHFASADYFETGIGYTFKYKSK